MRDASRLTNSNSNVVRKWARCPASASIKTKRQHMNRPTDTTIQRKPRPRPTMSNANGRKAVKYVIGASMRPARYDFGDTIYGACNAKGSKQSPRRINVSASNLLPEDGN